MRHRAWLCRWGVLVLGVALAAGAPRAAAAQTRGAAQARATARAQPGRQGLPELHVREDSGGPRWSVPLALDRGYAAVHATLLDSLGWKVDALDGHALLDGPAGVRVDVRAGTPFFRWNDTILQLADPPYVQGGVLYVPLQLLSDFLPARLPHRYAFDGDSLRLWWKGPPKVPGAKLVKLLPVDSTRVVVIDPGHGGIDPGTIGPGGIKEKTIALAIAKDLAADLAKVPHLKVYLTRHTDEYVALWDRGRMATRWKGNRPGVFISIHANSTPSDRATIRGFETYILSAARTEHERRVAAIENAPLGVDTTDGGKASSDLDYILRDMKNLNTQHWSSLLAQMIQDQMAKVDPEPDRGVKQAPLAVITNALMPAVLVEVGYLSNPEGARMLARRSFQVKAAEAIAKAVQDFFGRYPPRSGDASGGRPEGR